MGTRALTTVLDSDNKAIIALYRQSDGYQDSHGKQLKTFLETKIMVNGISNYHIDIANGMGCLAAQMVSNFKEKPGLFYIYPIGKADDWVDFFYTVYPSDKSDNPLLCVKVESYGCILYDGLVSEYVPEDKYED